MRRSSHRKSDERRKDANSAVVTEDMTGEDRWDAEPQPVPDVLVHTNYRLLIASAAVIVALVAIGYLAHEAQVSKHARRLKELAEAAEAEGDLRTAIGHLTRYLRFQRDQSDSQPLTQQRTETLVHLAGLHSGYRDSFADQQLAYNYLEEALRSEPDRHEDRRRQIDVCMRLGRFRDALEHLDYLFQSDPPTASDPQLLSHQVRALTGLREFVRAQQSHCRLIAAAPDNCDWYVSLAALVAAQPGELWSPDADEIRRLFPHGAPRVVNAFPARPVASRSDPGRQAALQTVESILKAMTDFGQPPWDAHRRRAVFLAQLDSTFDAPPVSPDAAPERAGRLVDELDRSRDGVLDAQESHSSTIPAFADLDDNGLIESQELSTTLQEGGRFRRLEEARSSIEASRSLAAGGSGADAAGRSLVLRTAAEIHLELAEAWRYDDVQRARDYVAIAREAAAEAAALSDRSPASLLAKAKLEIRLLGFEDSVDSRQARLNQAISLLEEARGLAAASPGDSTQQGADRVRNVQRLLTEIEVALGDALVTRLQSARSDEIEATKTRIRDDIIPSLQKQNAPQQFINYLRGQLLVLENQWREAEIALRSAVEGVVLSGDLARRVGLLRALCAKQLADTELYLARTLAVHQANTSWAGGRIALAQAYQHTGNIEAAITEYAAYGTNPEITPVLARLLIQREQRKPFAERNWGPAENAIEVLSKQEANASVAPMLRSDLLFLQAVTEQFLHQTEGGAGLAEGARQKLQQADDLLRSAIDQFPDDPSIRRALAFLTVVRFDLSAEERLNRCNDILALAHEELGDSITLRTAAAIATRLMPSEDAIPTLNELERENPAFTPQERAAFLETLAAMYAGRGERPSAVDCCVEAARLVPTEISYPQAALNHLIALAMQNRGHLGDEQVNWDAMLDHLATIEGPDGPLAAYYKGTLMVLSVAAEPDRLNEPEAGRLLDQAHTLLRTAEQARPKWNLIPRMLGELEMLRHARSQGSGNEARYLQAAIAHFEKAAALGNLSEAVVARLVAHYLQSNREPDAQRLLERVGQERPEGLSDQLAVLAWQVENQLDEQSRAIDAYIKQAEGFGECGQKIRAALMRMGRGDLGPEVEQLLLDACELEPQSPDPWEWLVRYYVQRSRFVAARDKIDEAQQALPDEPPFLKPRTLARCFRVLARADSDLSNKQRATEQAEQNYDAAVEAASGNMSLYRERTEFFVETGQLDKARQSLARILDPKVDIPREVRLWAEHSAALVTADGGTLDDLTRGLELLRAAEVDTDEQRIFNLRSQLNILARRNRVADRREMVRLLEQLREIAGVRFTLGERLQLAALYEAAGDWPKAEAEYEALLKPDAARSGPTEPAVVASYALALLRQKAPLDDDRLARLNRFANELQQFAPAALETALVRAQLLHRQGRSSEAVPILQEYLDTLSYQPADQALRELIEQKDVDRAVELLKSALRSRQNPALARIVPHLEGLVRQQDTNEALSVLQRYLSASDLAVGLQTEMLRVIAGVLEEFGETQAAEDLYRRYVAKSAQPAEASLALVGFLGRQNRIDEALDRCEQVWDKLADPLRAAENSVAVVRHGKPTEHQIARVEQLLTDAIKRSQDPKVRVQYQIYVADLRDVQHRTSEAVQIYEKILEVNDRDLVALNNLAWMLAFQSGREAQALTLINRAIELAGPLPAFRDTRAIISLQLNQPQQAVDDLVAAIDQAGDDPELWFHLAQAYLKQGNREQAREAFRNAQAKGLNVNRLHRLQHGGYQQLQREFGETAGEVAAGPGGR